MFKNIIVISLFTLPVAIFFALKYNSTQFYHYILNIGNMETSALIQIYSNFSLLPSFNLLMIFLWGVLQILCVCLLVSYMERHLKYGIKSCLKAFKTVNYSVLVVAPAFITVICIEEFVSFLISLFVKLLSLSQSSLVGVILPVMYICFIVLLFLIYSTIALWIPIKMVTGYTNRDSIRYSIRMTQGRQFQIMMGLMFPFIVVTPVMIGLKHLSMIQGLNTAIYVFCYIFIFGYLLAYMMITYFNLSGIERKDCKKKLF